MEPLRLDLPDELSTDRLVLRMTRADDIDRIWPSIEESQKELAEWMPWAYPTPQRDKCDEFCRRTAANFILREQFNFQMYLKDVDTHIGSCGIPRLKWSVPWVEIGYWLRTSHCRKGYMTEAVNAVTAFALNHLKAARVEIRCDDRNARSSAVAERAGFKLEGILHHDERDTRDQLRDTRIYAKIAG